jgi:DNA-binding GntR family transcriptional regulator
MISGSDPADRIDEDPIGSNEAVGEDRRSRVDLVTAALRQAVLDGRLRPGERISQEGLALEFGTSRVPVREALRRLESEGLITLVPRSGAWVAKLAFDEYTEVYRIREWLEPPAVAASVPHLTDAQVAELGALVEAMEAQPDDVEWLDLDRRFHLLSYAGAPLPRLKRMIEGFWTTTQQYRRAHFGYLGGSGDLVQVHAEHRLLLSAIRRKDAEAAEELLRMHIRRTRNDLARSPELFDA